MRFGEFKKDGSPVLDVEKLSLRMPVTYRAVSWEEIVRQFTCHRCHHSSGDLVPAGGVMYHWKCIPPSIFRKLALTPERPAGPKHPSDSRSVSEHAVALQDTKLDETPLVTGRLLNSGVENA